jgi:hypothetical protein
MIYCGSMVLYLSRMSFFAQLGEKTTYEELNMTGTRKSYTFL